MNPTRLGENFESESRIRIFFFYLPDQIHESESTIANQIWMTYQIRDRLKEKVDKTYLFASSPIIIYQMINQFTYSPIQVQIFD